MPYPIPFSYPFLLTFMTETTNFPRKKSSDGTSIPSKDSQDQQDHIVLDPQQALDMPPEVYKAIQYLEYRRLRHKHPHC